MKIETNEIALGLREYTREELIFLSKIINSEIDRTNNFAKKVLYVHDCADDSTYHHNSNKHFAKRIVSIDDTKDNGFAFTGEFLNTKKENLVPNDCFVLERCHNSLYLYKVTDDIKELILKGSSSSYVSFIRKSKELTNL